MSSGPPLRPPVGLRLATAAKRVSRAFDDALAAAGGSRPTWLVLMTLRRAGAGNQAEIASAIGIRGATLSHHLTAMENEGLISRNRGGADRRHVQVTLTEDGLARFDALRDVAREFDERLRRGLDEDQVQQLFALLGRLEDNVGGHEGSEDPPVATPGGPPHQRERP